MPRANRCLLSTNHSDCRSLPPRIPRAAILKATFSKANAEPQAACALRRRNGARAEYVLRAVSTPGHLPDIPLSLSPVVLVLAAAITWNGMLNSVHTSPQKGVLYPAQKVTKDASGEKRTGDNMRMIIHPEKLSEKRPSTPICKTRLQRKHEKHEDQRPSQADQSTGDS